MIKDFRTLLFLGSERVWEISRVLFREDQKSSVLIMKHFPKTLIIKMYAKCICLL
jgi:hypothetical protein